MYTLILDTSTKNMYIALVNHEEVVYEKYSLGFNDHAKYILIYVNEALKLNNITLKDINKVICGNGPGSYTGTRISVVVSKMICSLFSNTSLYKISSLRLMTSYYKDNVVAFIDARRDNGYMAYYQNDVEIIKEGIYNKTEFLNKIKDDYLLIDDMNMKVCPINVIKHAVVVKSPYEFTPNYVQLTEAERNLYDNKKNAD